MAAATVRVRYEGGAETDIDVPEDGTLAREMFDDHVTTGRYVILDGAEAVSVEPPVDDDEPGTDGRPAKSAPKTEWEAYAASLGATPDEIAEATKAELIERYGA